MKAKAQASSGFMLRTAKRCVNLFTQAHPLAWVILILFILLTILMVRELHAREEYFAQEQFSLQMQEVSDAIAQRMKAHEQILIGAVAVFDASEEVSRAEWRAYVERLALPRHYPGIQAVGFSRVIQPQNLEAHIAARHSEGFSHYQVQPPGARQLYTAIDYIEPFSGRNLAAFGFDMFSEPVRRMAMTKAVEDNATRISSKVTLVQENQGKVQPGFLMYIPVYQHGLPTATSAERWQALQGFVYSPYRVDDLMAGILGQRNLNIHFEIYAAVVTDEPALLYRSAGSEQVLGGAKFTRKSQLEIYGQIWTLTFFSEPKTQVSFWFRLDQLVLMLGVSISILLFLLISFLASERQRARALAGNMTEDIQQKVQALRLSEERFRLALDSSSMGTWNWYLAENRIHWDKSIYPLFGLSEGEYLDSYESFLALLHNDDRARVFQEIASAMEGGTQYDTEYRIIWPDGSLHYIASRAKVLLGQDQKPLLMTGTCWDITEGIHVERMKNEFVSTVSHELRTPLTSLTGAIGLLASGAMDSAPEKMRLLIEIASKNAQRLKLLIDDLLDMEKLSTGKMVFDLQVVPLIPLLKRALDENKIYAEQYQVGFRLNALVAVVSVRVDSSRFLQVMANLLSNAVKFSGANSEIIVRVSMHSEKMVRIAVIDRGIGIPAAEQIHIFEKFYQVDASDTRKKGGTGLGLSITKVMVEQMQGNLEFVSKEGEGSTFFIDLPIIADMPIN